MKFLKFSFFVLLLTTFFISCQKEYSFEGSKSGAGSWQFNDSTKLYTGTFDSAVIQTTGSTKTLLLVGPSSDGKQTFSMRLYSTDSFTIGTYKASLYQTDFEYYTQAKTIYQADQLSGEFIVNITQLSNNTITGTFSGAAEDSANNIKQLTLGKFTARINLTGNGTGGGTGGTAIGTLGASAGSCTPVSPSGTYTQGIALTSSNTVQIQVNVTTAGTYTISTGSVNGVTFSKSGTFSSTGLQNVILVGNGTPVNSGSQNFSVSFGSSTCSFPITFLPGTAPPVGDYLPLTANSNWTFALTDLSNGNTDSLFDKVVPNTITLSGKVYTIVSEESFPVSGNPDDSLYYRKPGGDYYEYLDLAYFGFDNSTGSGEYIFLKDNVAQGTTWQSQTFSTTYNGTPVTLYIKMTLTAKAVPVTMGALNFPDVIKMTYEYFVGGTSAITEERWFARGVGLIYDTDKTSFTQSIGSYVIK